MLSVRNHFIGSIQGSSLAFCYYKKPPHFRIFRIEEEITISQTVQAGGLVGDDYLPCYFLIAFELSISIIKGTIFHMS